MAEMVSQEPRLKLKLLELPIIMVTAMVSPMTDRQHHTASYPRDSSGQDHLNDGLPTVVPTP